MTTTEIQSLLQTIGFEPKESQVYLTCLQLGPSTVWDIHLKANVKRPTCYLILDKLVERGLAMKSPQGHHTLYSVVDPIGLLVHLDARRRQLELALPDLERLAAQPADQSLIQTFEGQEGLYQAYLLGLQQAKGDEILVLGNAELWLQYPTANESYIAERKKRGIVLREILPDTPINREFAASDPANKRVTRFFPVDRFNPRLETEIFGSTVLFIAHSEQKPFATVMNNESAATDQRLQFELLWGLAIK